jgi:hypothetical protein
VEGVTGTVLEKRIAQRRTGDPVRLVADNRRLLALGWKPRFDDLPAMVEHAYNWQRALAKPPPVLDETVPRLTRGRPSRAGKTRRIRYTNDIIRERDIRERDDGGDAGRKTWEFG